MIKAKALGQHDRWEFIIRTPGRDCDRLFFEQVAFGLSRAVERGKPDESVPSDTIIRSYRMVTLNWKSLIDHGNDSFLQQWVPFFLRSVV